VNNVAKKLRIQSVRALPRRGAALLFGGRRARVSGPALVISMAAVAFSVMVVSAGPTTASETSVSTAPADIQAGTILYNEHCSSCHGANGVGSVKAPELIDAGAAAADFYLETGRMPLNNPGDQALRHEPFFSATQIRQLVAYINNLGVQAGREGPTIPTVSPVCDVHGGAGNVASSQAGNYGFEGAGGAGGVLGGHGSGLCTTLAEGQQLFSLNCAQCHDASGSGGMLSHGDIVPSMKDSTATQVAEAVRVGPLPMPVFGPNQLSDHQVSALANYVEYLRRPADRGGLAIAHFGPVPEGFVGIVIGLFVLLIASRLIGTRE